MPRAWILLAAALLALSATQSGAAPSNSDSEDNVRRLMKAVVESIGENAESRFVGDEPSFVQNYLKRVEKLVSELRTRSTDTCIAAAQTEFFRLKGLSSFITCANLTEALFNIKEITSKTFDVLSKIFVIVEGDLNAFDKCFPFKTEANWKCADKVFWQCFDTGKNVVTILKAYGAKVGDLYKKVKEEIDYCLHPATDLKSEIQSVIGVFVSCTMNSH